MTESRTTRLIRRYFHERSLRVKVLLTQAPLSLTVMLLVIHAVLIYPEVFGKPIFTAGLWMHAAILALCLLVPWDRLPHPSFLAIPYLDFVAIGFTRQGSLEYATSAGLLILFPVFWLAASGLARKTAVVSSAVATLLLVWTPVFLATTPVAARDLGKPLLFPFMMAGFAVAVVTMTSSMDSQRLQVVAKDAQLRASLKASRQREQLLSTVLDTVAVGLVVVDGGGHDQLMNSMQRANHALAVPEGVVNPAEKDLLVFAGDKTTPLEAEARPVRRAVKGESFTNYPIWIGSGDRARAFSTTARTIRNEDGDYDGAVIAFQDITDMTAAMAAKDDFVANVSHEFRTPLTSIQGYLALALDEPELLPGDVAKYLTVAERNADRLSGLVADLLTTDAMEVEKSLADVAGLVADSLASARPAAAINGVELTAQAPASLAAWVDPVRIGQVLDNLVSNAVKYSPDGGTVTVRLWASGRDLLCEVQDTGLGMSSAEQAEAFTKFFRADSALQRSIPGLGLGLMITRSIVTRHGGTISVCSERNVGTTMRLVLPDCVEAPGAS
ncbi:cell wall metabolism sensor histidine kinase WalK [Arthrobacter sp. SDTb3-6]|uniref:sensor histidine kinase n=1 Tax=Arthrobacter sp. SDTb3-6 TaxID=2713571 RepID=UPI00159E7DA6|nr:HAMP domain-containing sensor histidine kinase [Arthrobacter sp. SDTb3-6]NVM99931.1 HAMP domain-containing histidine kinase [Arthrobacter sp. SDTb3-6]